MEKQRISLQELSVGQPLPWDVYDQDGKLLLRCGEIVHSQKTIDRFIESGLYAEKDTSNQRTHPSVIEIAPSALQLIVDARRMLAGIFEQPPAGINDFVVRIAKLILTVRTACDTHQEVSLASIMLLQDGLYSVKHPTDVAILSYILAKAMALDDATQHAVIAAALTMNIGMYEMQEKINTINGSLNEKLQSMIKRHPTLGVERLTALGITDEKWLAFVRQHHEHNDGSGYPDGLSGDAIEMGAKIICFAAKYCGMVSVRSYKPPQKPTTALRDVLMKHGQKVDIVVAGTMIRVVSLYPPGTLLRLKTGEVAVVTGPGNGPDTPAAYAVTGRSGASLEVASYRKTHLADYAIEDVLTIDKLSIPVRMASIWPKDAKLR